MFAPAPGASVPVYFYGQGAVKHPVFTCPVSAIPDQVWDLIDLFFQCRALRALPVAGGVLDQPLVVRRAWPVLEHEMEQVDRARRANADQGALAATIAALVGRKIGSKRRT